MHAAYYVYEDANILKVRVNNIRQKNKQMFPIVLNKKVNKG